MNDKKKNANVAELRVVCVTNPSHKSHKQEGLFTNYEVAVAPFHLRVEETRMTSGTQLPCSLFIIDSRPFFPLFPPERFICIPVRVQCLIIFYFTLKMWHELSLNELLFDGHSDRNGRAVRIACRPGATLTIKLYPLIIGVFVEEIRTLHAAKMAILLCSMFLGSFFIILWR